MIIAIDGPSGVGKGTVARAVAAALGVKHVDTGAMYRAVAWRAEQLGLPLDDEAQIEQLATGCAIAINGSEITIDGADASQAIRTPEIDRATTRIARLPNVRAALVARQRAMGLAGGVVMEGRDIGTVVFPDADVKIFLDASADERARRRAHDPAHTSSQTQQLADIAQAMQKRDESDRTRRASPLARAEDAVLIDTTEMPIPQVVERVMDIVAGKRGTGKG